MNIHGKIHLATRSVMTVAVTGLLAFSAYGFTSGFPVKERPVKMRQPSGSKGTEKPSAGQPSGSGGAEKPTSGLNYSSCLPPEFDTDGYETDGYSVKLGSNGAIARFRFLNRNKASHCDLTLKQMNYQEPRTFNLFTHIPGPGDVYFYPTSTVQAPIAEKILLARIKPGLKVGIAYGAAGKFEPSGAEVIPAGSHRTYEIELQTFKKYPAYSDAFFSAEELTLIEDFNGSDSVKSRWNLLKNSYPNVNPSDLWLNSLRIVGKYNSVLDNPYKSFDETPSAVWVDELGKVVKEVANWEKGVYFSEVTFRTELVPTAKTLFPILKKNPLIVPVQ